MSISSIIQSIHIWSRRYEAYSDKILQKKTSRRQITFEIQFEAFTSMCTTSKLQSETWNKLKVISFQ